MDTVTAIKDRAAREYPGDAAIADHPRQQQTHLDHHPHEQARHGVATAFRKQWGDACRKAKITGLTFHDLRGTAVTRLAEAECSHAEIAAITGHSMRDVGAILDKYLARTDKISLAAIAKLERGRA